MLFREMNTRLTPFSHSRIHATRHNTMIPAHSPTMAPLISVRGEKSNSNIIIIEMVAT